MQIALGPLQYYWPREQVFDFYAQASEWPIDRVYLGETVCSRRRELRIEDWLALASELSQAGKQVVLSTQVLLESRVELRTLEKITTQKDYLVEANDMGAIHQMQGRPFVAGPFLNVYSPPVLDLLAAQGAKSWVMPLEMDQQGLSAMLQECPADLETEVFAFGRMPLAFSARCFTARNRNLPKDNCQYVCIEHPDGLLLKTQEKESFLNINGIQTQSARVYNLMQELPVLQSMGVNRIRLSPQSRDMDAIVTLFNQVIQAQISADRALAEMTPLLVAEPCNGYWYGHPGQEMLLTPATSIS
ncbi:MAG TPA: U32 family peptidase [Paenalcaligenes sp.]|nr:U32 family peptidase [Paenalcaligenes sp.]